MNNTDNLSLKFLTALDALYKKERRIEIKVIKKKGKKKIKYQIPQYSNNSGMSEIFAIRLVDTDFTGRWFELYEKGDSVKMVSALYANDVRELERMDFASSEFFIEKHNGVDAVFILDNEHYKIKIHVVLWGESLETSRSYEIPYGRHTLNRHFVHHHSLLTEFAESISYNMLTAKLLNKSSGGIVELKDLYRSFDENVGQEDYGFHILALDKIVDDDKERRVDIFFTIWDTSFQSVDEANPVEWLHKPMIYVRYWNNDKQERVKQNIHAVNFDEDLGKDGAVYKFSDSEYELCIIVDYSKFKHEHAKDWFEARFGG